MSGLKEALAAAANRVLETILPPKQSYMMVTDEDGMTKYEPYGRAVHAAQSSAEYHGKQSGTGCTLRYLTFKLLLSAQIV